MKAIILAAGYATRLYPITKDYPKPLLQVGGKPIIDHIIEKIERLKEVDEILVVTNSRFYRHFEDWSMGLKVKKPVVVVDDLTRNLDDRRGAVGDMHFVIQKRKLRDDLLVLGGDNIFDEGLEGFVAYAKASEPNPVMGAYDIKKRQQASKYGVLKMDATNRITGFQEKPKHPESTLIAMCLYYFNKARAGLVDEYMRARRGKHDAVGFYIEWLIKKLPVYAYVFSGRWFDIGDHKCYRQAKRRFK